MVDLMMTSCMPCSFGLLPTPGQVRDVRPAHRPPRSDRGCPLDTARDRCFWHVGGTADENDGSHLAATAPAVLLGEAHPPWPPLHERAAKAARQVGVTSSL